MLYKVSTVAVIWGDVDVEATSFNQAVEKMQASKINDTVKSMLKNSLNDWKVDVVSVGPAEFPKPEL